jgi:hypothetical protein
MLRLPPGIENAPRKWREVGDISRDHGQAVNLGGNSQIDVAWAILGSVDT